MESGQTVGREEELEKNIGILGKKVAGSLHCVRHMVNLGFEVNTSRIGSVELACAETQKRLGMKSLILPRRAGYDIRAGPRGTDSFFLLHSLLYFLLHSPSRCHRIFSRTPGCIIPRIAVASSLVSPLHFLLHPRRILFCIAIVSFLVSPSPFIASLSHHFLPCCCILRCILPCIPVALSIALSAACSWYVSGLL